MLDFPRLVFPLEEIPKMKSLIASLVLLSAVAFAQTPPPNAGPGKHQVALTCTPSTSTVSGYNFYRSTTSGSGFVKLNSGLATGCQFTDTTVLAGSTYFFVGTAVDASGNESSFSNQITTVIPATPPSPSGVKVNPGNTQTILTWNAATGAAFYNIYRQDAGSTVAPTKLGFVTAPVVTYTDTTVVVGKTYQYFVTTVTTAGSESILSAPALQLPAPPTGLTAVVI